MNICLSDDSACLAGGEEGAGRAVADFKLGISSGFFFFVSFFPGETCPVLLSPGDQSGRTLSGMWDLG